MLYLRDRNKALCARCEKILQHQSFTMYTSPELRITFVSCDLRSLFETTFCKLRDIQYKSVASTSEIRIFFSSHDERLKFLHNVAQASSIKSLGISAALISTGTRASVFINQERDIWNLYGEAAEHCNLIER